MSGKCYGCGDKFGIFKKEYGCKNCGFAFCSKCLDKKVEVPKRNNEKLPVCNKCFNILTGKKKPSDQKYSPPENFKKRMAVLEAKGEGYAATPLVSGTAQNAHKAKQYARMDKKDVQIAQRLEKMKEERRKMEGPVASEDEIRARLAALKGEDPAKASSGTSQNKYYVPPDTRKNEEKIDDLMAQISDEIDIDERFPNPADDVAARLKHLRGDGGTDKTGPNSSQNNLNDMNATSQTSASANLNVTKDDGEKDNLEADIEAYIKQAAKEAELDAKAALAGIQKDKEIMERLAKLKEERKSKDKTSEGAENVNDEVSDEENEEDFIKRLIAQSIAESKLDDEVEESGYADVFRKKSNERKKSNIQAIFNISGSDTDELPWCCICNNNAIIRCHSCDNDLFCSRCFREGHDKYEREEHSTSKYNAPNT